MKRAEIEFSLNNLGITFFEMNTRMSYGLIGHLKRGEKLIALIYRGSFYIHDKDFPINSKTLSVIQDIQSEFENNIRDGNNKIVTAPGGIGYKTTCPVS